MFYTVYSVQYITPPGEVFQGRLLDNPRACQYRTIRVRKALGEMVPNADLFGTDTIIPTSCGDIEHGTSAQGGLIMWYTPSSNTILIPLVREMIFMSTALRGHVRNVWVCTQVPKRPLIFGTQCNVRKRKDRFGEHQNHENGPY